MHFELVPDAVVKDRIRDPQYLSVPGTGIYYNPGTRNPDGEITRYAMLHSTPNGYRSTPAKWEERVQNGRMIAFGLYSLAMQYNGREFKKRDPVKWIPDGVVYFDIDDDYLGFLEKTLPEDILDMRSRTHEKGSPQNQGYLDLMHLYVLIEKEDPQVDRLLAFASQFKMRQAAMLLNMDGEELWDVVQIH